MHTRKTAHDAPDFYDRQARRQPASLSVNGDLLRQASDLGIDLSAALEEALVALLRSRQREGWRAENREAIEVYNELVDRHGMWSDGLRSF